MKKIVVWLLLNKLMAMRQTSHKQNVQETQKNVSKQTGN